MVEVQLRLNFEGRGGETVAVKEALARTASSALMAPIVALLIVTISCLCSIDVFTFFVRVSIMARFMYVSLARKSSNDPQMLEMNAFVQARTFR